MPNRSGSNRIGWNQRGPTIKQQMEWVRELGDPDSYHWQNKANNLKYKLVEIMGPDEFEDFADMTWPGESINSWTWHGIYDLYLAKLEDLNCLDL